MLNFKEIAELICPLDRAIISDGYDKAIGILSSLIPFKVHEIESHKDAWTWKIPEKWTVEYAYFTDGKTKYADYKEHPLHIISYSDSFENRVSRKELLEHVFTNPEYPNEIPFKYSYYNRKWGFCLPYDMLKNLNSDFYDVKIKTKFEKGTLKIGEYYKQGKSDQTIVIMGHLCHPSQFNDGLSGVLMATAIAQLLESYKDTSYSYRILFFPEVVGSIAYLSQNEDIIKNLKGAIFLEMLGCDQPFSLQHSFQKDAYIDKVAIKVLKDMDIDFREGDFLSIIRNDERTFNSPGVMVPSISLSRSNLPGDKHFPFNGYHTSKDNVKNADFSKMAESYNVLKEIIFYVENDYYPKRNFKGQFMLSRYGLWVEPNEDRELYNKIEKLMWLLEGDKSVIEIALELDLDYKWLIGYLDRYAKSGLVEKIYDKGNN